MGVSRRVVLRIASAAMGAATGATAGAGDVRAPFGAPTAADWRALAAGLAGTLARPGDTDYDRVRLLNDPRYDDIRPPAIARCARPDDVAEVIRFANRYRLTVLARGGGHSYLGASTGATAVVVDLRPLDRVAFDAATRTATIGGGARLGDVYAGLDRHGGSVPAGSCGTVGIGGLALGGGIGMASSLAGLTCDAVTSLTIVGADGRPRTVDAEREPDLFWACRGGGGGRFGVVTEWRLRTFRTGDVGRFTLRWHWRDAAAAITGWQRYLATMPDSTWCHLQLSTDHRGRREVRIAGHVLGDGPEPALRTITALVGRDPLRASVDSVPYLSAVRAVAGTAARRTELVGSDVFREPLPAAGTAALIAMVERRAAERRPGVAKLKPLTNAVARVPVDATAFPWRGARSLLQWLVVPAGGGRAVSSGYAWIAAGHRAVARWSAGRYVNYLEPGPLTGYHGPHADRLRRLRDRYDTHRRFG